MVNPITAANGIANGISTALSGAQSALGILSGGTFWEQLRPANYKGVPFLVSASSATIARKYSEHNYPLRDGAWVEDLGARAPRLHIRAFFVGDDCIAQRQKLITVVNHGGTGDLVHPTLGRLTPVSCVEANFTEEKSQGRVLSVELVFIDGIERIYPTAQSNTPSVVVAAASKGFLAAAADFVSSAASTLSAGIAAVQGVVATAQSWTQSALNAYRAVTSLVNLVKTLPGTFGRQFGSLSSGFSSSPSTAPTSSSTRATVQTLEGQVVVAAAQQQSAASAVVSAAQGLAVSTLPMYAAAVQAFVLTAAQTASTPRMAIQSLIAMAAPTPAPVNPPGASGAATTALQSAISDLHRRSAAIALAQASSSYQPSSANDAADVRDQVTAVLDAEITTAGDQGNDATYLALVALRAAVVQDLNARGAALPAVININTGAPIPSLALAQRLYRDPTRADELVTEANPPHPAFMPVSFQGLAS
jgi:prophage DNA circulation protein